MPSSRDDRPHLLVTEQRGAAEGPMPLLRIPECPVSRNRNSLHRSGLPEPLDELEDRLREAKSRAFAKPREPLDSGA